MMILSLLYCLAVVALVSASVGAGVDGGSNQKPIFHITPTDGHWINDPNGPFYDQHSGLYHLFAQYNPNGADWGDMSWMHWTSSDLVSWTVLKVAIFNDMPYDQYGAFSGSIIMLDQTNHPKSSNKVPILWYTCVDENQYERQCLAWPQSLQDQNFTNWTKSAQNPIIDFTSLPKEYNPLQFRDPSIWTKSNGKNEYWLAMAAEIEEEGTVVLYSCSFVQEDNTLTTTSSSPASASAATTTTAMATTPPIASNCSFYSTLWNAQDNTSSYHTYMVECPDVYPLPKEDGRLHVLKFSVMEERRDLYEIGYFDESKGVFTRDLTDFPNRLEYDYGPNNHFYASKTFVYSTKKQEAQDHNHEDRVLWGWSPEVDDLYVSRNWAGAMALPRLVSYSSLWKTLHFNPHPNLKSLRKQETAVLIHEQLLKPNENGLFVKELPIDSLATEIQARFSLKVSKSWIASSAASCSVEVGFLGRASSIPVHNYLPDVYTKHGMRLTWTASSSNVTGAELVLETVIDTEHSGGSTPLVNQVKTVPGDVQAWFNSLSNSPYGSSSDIVVPLDMQVFYDYSIVETYVLHGASASTTRIYPDNANHQLAMYATVSAKCMDHISLHIDQLQSWKMNSIWKD